MPEPGTLNRPSELRPIPFRSAFGRSGHRRLLAATAIAVLAVGLTVRVAWSWAISAMGETPADAAIAPSGESSEVAEPREAAAASAATKRRRFHGPSAAALRGDAERREQLERLRRLHRQNAGQVAPVTPTATATAVKSATAEEPGSESSPAETHAVVLPPAESTLRYWTVLNGVIDKESTERGSPLASSLRDEGQAKEFLERRSAAAKKAAEMIGRSDRQGVDPEVLAIADRLTSWYEDSVRVAEHGSRVLESPAKERRGSPGKTWQNEEQALARKAIILNQEAESVRTRMARKYGLGFPVLK